MRINFDTSALRRTRWYEYGLRVFFGGAVTVVAGWIAKRYGPVFGGLFLAFPAIFPASATLVQKHEAKKKRKAGVSGHTRGRKAAALDARGATWGCVALASFAGLVWRSLPGWNAGVSLAAALTIWLLIASLAWRLSRLRFWKQARQLEWWLILFQLLIAFVLRIESAETTHKNRTLLLYELYASGGFSGPIRQVHGLSRLAIRYAGVTH